MQKKSRFVDTSRIPFLAFTVVLMNAERIENYRIEELLGVGLFVVCFESFIEGLGNYTRHWIENRVYLLPSE